MEHKIGEIFEYNGEWYQCIKSNGTCNGCAGKFQPYSFCNGFEECVGKIFKKLEKVGEPYFNGQYGEVLQEYKYYIPPITPDLRIYIIRLGIVGIELKQNKKDMEEREFDPHMAKVIDEATQKMGEEIGKQIEENINKQRMKPFDLEAAKAGKPVRTRDGRKVRIICFDRKDVRPIVALIKSDNGDEGVYYYYADGLNLNNYPSVFDLMMFPKRKRDG